MPAPVEDVKSTERLQGIKLCSAYVSVLLCKLELNIQILSVVVECKYIYSCTILKYKTNIVLFTALHFSDSFN